MLNWEMAEHIEKIKDTAFRVWGGNVELNEVDIKKGAPYPIFTWDIKLYEKVDVHMEYDRSVLAIGLPKDGEYAFMDDFTEKPVFDCLKVLKGDNLLHNFLILDEIAKRLIGEGTRGKNPKPEELPKNSE